MRGVAASLALGTQALDDAARRQARVNVPEEGGTLLW
jgi:hypothetical protein